MTDSHIRNGAVITAVPTAEGWQALKARLAKIETRLNAAGGE